MLQLFLLAAALFFSATLNAQQSLGVFSSSSDVGQVRLKGSTRYQAATDEYRLTGSGANIWGSQDQFHFAWKKMKGNFIVQARGTLQGKGVDPHRKFGWMIRTSLDSSSPMVAATVHGDGLTSLQYRKTAHGNVEEVKSALTAPDVIQLERRGDTFLMSTARFGNLFVTEQVAGPDLGDEVYVGLFICAHNADVLETVSFNNVRITVPARVGFVPYREYIGSRIEVLDVATGKRQVVYTDTGSVQAPNWTKDNKALLYNTNKGLMYRFDFRTGKPSLLPTDFVTANNNDHTLSFDGKTLGLSSSSSDRKYGSIVYTVPVQGGKPKQVTPTGPSYLHGFSPDGKYVLYTGQRNNEFDIYRMPVEGGEEVRLTTAPGLDDGSEYSPDGQYIYFNSDRSGSMQLWRMKADGSNQEQLTNDEFNNWFPHISPDGKWIAFLSYGKEVASNDHPFYKHVYLRLMPAGGGEAKVIAYFYGGQGSINTNSWAPDSKKLAFVSNSNDR